MLGDVPKVGYFRNIPDEFKIKSLYSNDLILNVASKSKETVQKLKFLDSPYAIIFYRPAQALQPPLRQYLQLNSRGIDPIKA